MNADWHRAHVLGSGAPMETRIAWHLEHARECACRPIPESVQRAIDAAAASAAPSIDP
jgi:hypothetical protein